MTSLIEGGHRVQQRRTAAALKAIGVDAEVVEVDDVGGWGADVVHFCGDPRSVIGKAPGSRLVVSPLYFPEWFHMGPMFWVGGRSAMVRHRARVAFNNARHRRLVRVRRSDFREQVASFTHADMIVVNSHAEGALLTADRADLPPLRVAYSGVDEAFFSGDPERGLSLLGIGSNEEFVLCVARVEPRKNQQSLARAMRGMSSKLVLVGEVLVGNEKYMAACRSERPDLHHVRYLPHDQLPHVYAAARVHALVSWFETTGLSSLEALAAGCPVVVASNPCVEEYFGACATVVDPGDIDAIAAAIEAALVHPRGCEQELAAKYSWSATANSLLAAYTDVVAGV